MTGRMPVILGIGIKPHLPATVRNGTGMIKELKSGQLFISPTPALIVCSG